MTEPQYKVGELYNTDRTVWTEGADFNYRRTEDGKGMLELRLFYRSLSESEIEVVNRGECSFGYTYLYDVISFLYNFGSAKIYGDCTFSSHLLSEEDRADLPEIGSKNYGKLFVILVEARTGIIKAMRLIQLSGDFSVYFYDVIGAERDKPFDREQYDLNIAKLHTRYVDVFRLFSIAPHVCIIQPKTIQN